MLLLFVSNNNSCNRGLNEDKLKAKREVELDLPITLFRHLDGMDKVIKLEK